MLTNCDKSTSTEEGLSSSSAAIVVLHEIFFAHLQNARTYTPVNECSGGGNKNVC